MRKPLMTLALLALCTISVASAQEVTPESPEATVLIDSEAKVVIGDLIVLDLTQSKGTGFDYYVDPVPPGLRTFDGGRVIVCGTGNKPITYTFMISCAYGENSDIAIHKVKVVGREPVPVQPKPVEPPAPLAPASPMVAKVKLWASQVQSTNKRDEARGLAQSFASMAVMIDTNNFNTAGELIAASARSNREAMRGNLDSWAGFLDNLMGELKTQAASGRLSTVKSHGPVWRDVAQGLREYADTLR
jgi:hypothetical protein